MLGTKITEFVHTGITLENNITIAANNRSRMTIIARSVIYKASQVYYRFQAPKHLCGENNMRFACTAGDQGRLVTPAGALGGLTERLVLLLKCKGASDLLLSSNARWL